MILLDTHVIVWARQDPDRLPEPALTQVTVATAWAISDISLWEIAMFVRKQRLQLTVPLHTYLGDIAATTTVLPITAAIAATVGTLPAEFPANDPADRIIYATAREHDLTLISADRQLRTHDTAVVWD